MDLEDAKRALDDRDAIKWKTIFDTTDKALGSGDLVGPVGPRDGASTPRQLAAELCEIWGVVTWASERQRDALLAIIHASGPPLTL